LTLEIGLLVGVRRLGGAELELGCQDLLLQIRVRHLEDDTIRLDLRARAEDVALDATGGGGRDPPDVLGDERAGAADLTDHRSALDRVDPHRRAVHTRRGRPEARHADGDANDREEGNGAVEDPSDLFLSFDFWRASDINH
jgi:hypothetical protein